MESKSELLPPAEIQRATIFDYLAQPFADCCFMVSKAWWNCWEDYTSRASGSAPGPIDNIPLVYAYGFLVFRDKREKIK